MSGVFLGSLGNRVFVLRFHFSGFLFPLSFGGAFSSRLSRGRPCRGAWCLFSLVEGLTYAGERGPRMFATWSKAVSYIVC